jgi:uncharacterized membrane protein
MSDRAFAILTFVCALGCGLNGGVFFAFSAFVMPALARLPPPQGIAAMKSVNVFAVTPVFMTALFGTPSRALFWASGPWSPGNGQVPHTRSQVPCSLSSVPFS